MFSTEKSAAGPWKVINHRTNIKALDPSAHPINLLPMKIDNCLDNCLSSKYMLSLLLSISFRHFDIKSREDLVAAAALFSVPDFVGDASKAIASRVRGAVASVQFDDFHKV